MKDVPLTLTLMVLTTLALVAWLLAVVRLRARAEDRRLAVWQVALSVVATLGSAILFAYRAVFVHGNWRPLQAHVDGLLLIAALLGGVILFLQSRARLRALGAFALPLLTLVLAWAICASYWTFQRFTIESVWDTLHLFSVYGGTLFVALAATAGLMFLHVQRQLRRKADLTHLGRLASLETLEDLIVRASAMGFALITLGLLTGVVTMISRGHVEPQWWYSSKIVLTVLAWAIFAVVMNVRHGTHFRGARAAWLSVFGLVLLLATFAIVVANARHRPAQSVTNVPASIRTPEAP